MAKINDGGPAFPVPNADFTEAYGGAPGMSLRDWFAGQFLAGACSDKDPLNVSIAADQHEIDAALKAHWSKVARAAFIAADAMIAARAEGGAG
ncbi:MAG: hypothetical protein E2577_13650 [Starkeya sp.]|nr:hypothetical protein [Starkeya sp.]